MQELLTSKVLLLDASFGQTIHNLCLGGNGCVVGTGYPASILSVETCFAHQDVLYGVVEHVAHVKHSGYIWRRDNYGVGFPTIGLTAE